MPSNPMHSGSGKRSWKKTHSVISWDAASPADLKGAILAVTNSGGAVMFGRTADEGSLVLSAFRGDERIKEYCDKQGEISDLLQWLMAELG